MKRTTAILGIDIQNDFTVPSGNLFVKGANSDVIRMAAFMDTFGANIDYVALTLDSHQPIHIANQCYWKDNEGYPPALFSVISAEDVENGRWKPQYNQELALPYLKALEEKGEVCMIWPPHCLMGGAGWAVNNIWLRTLYSWSIYYDKTYELFFKGTHQATEHYSALKSMVEYDNAEETKLNTQLLTKLDKFDRILLIGEAADYCVVHTLNDLLEYAPHMAEKIVVMTDCMSWIDPNNEWAKEKFEAAYKKGVKHITTKEYYSILDNN
jgi:nicotinamidase/pyrazinamidase